MKKIGLIILFFIFMGCTNTNTSIEDIAPNYQYSKNGTYGYELLPGTVTIQKVKKEFGYFDLKSNYRKLGHLNISDGTYKGFRYIRGIQNDNVVHLTTVIDRNLILGEVHIRNEEDFIPIFYNFVLQVDKKIESLKNGSIPVVLDIGTKVFFPEVEILESHFYKDKSLTAYSAEWEYTISKLKEDVTLDMINEKLLELRQVFEELKSPLGQRYFKVYLENDKLVYIAADNYKILEGRPSKKTLSNDTVFISNIYKNIKD